MWDDTLATNLALLEMALIFLLALLAPFCASQRVERFLSRMNAVLGRLASHRGWCIVLVGLLTLAAKAALVPVLGIRAPMSWSAWIPAPRMGESPARAGKF